MGLLVAVATGVALAASAGLRAFLPLFAVGAAARWFAWPLSPSVQWLASDLALVCFGVATLIELVADKFPMIDHGLDALQTVTSPVAGVLVALSPLHGLPMPLAVGLAIVAGAPIAGGIHALGALTRLKSTAATAGAGNPILSVIEDVAAIGAVILAFVAPIVVLAVTVWMFVRWKRQRKVIKT
jgi:hypothetical protein